MKIIGANLCRRPSGKKIRDAGACLVEDGIIKVAIAEERITRIKHDGAIVNSILYCMNAVQSSVDDIDLFVFSMCGTLPPTVDYVYQYLQGEGLTIPESKISICPSHHLSHAASAFFASGFQESLIVVADRDGSILSGEEPMPFSNSVEHISYYRGTGNRIELIERDETMVGDIGLGLGYSYVTEWLGFDGHSMPGKTMALAAYGDYKSLLPAHFFSLEQNHIHCHLEPIDCDKSLAVRRLILKETGKDIGAHCMDPCEQVACDVASLVQHDLETVMIEKLMYLKNQTGLHNLCFAGGVALNCKLNYQILQSNLFDYVFIQPAAGDTGQCLGNALYGYRMLCNGSHSFAMTHAYFGAPYLDDQMEEAIQAYADEIVIEKTETLCASVAQRLMEDKVVAWFQGGSEFGPRALGHRSIIASPVHQHMRDYLNCKIKYRERFRPFGVFVLSEDVANYFDFQANSPFMLIAPQVLEQAVDLIPSAVHVDESCRIQTVDSSTDQKLFQLLLEFKKISGISVLINTSFNIKGEPIVETPMDALRSFVDSQMDVLVLGDYVITHKYDHNYRK